MNYFFKSYHTVSWKLTFHQLTFQFNIILYESVFMLSFYIRANVVRLQKITHIHFASRLFQWFKKCLLKQTNTFLSKNLCYLRLFSVYKWCINGKILNSYSNQFKYGGTLITFNQFDSCISNEHKFDLFSSDIHTEAVQAALAKHKEEKMALPMPTKRRSTYVQSPIDNCTPPGKIPHTI